MTTDQSAEELIQRQGEQIAMLVNLLLAVLNGEDDARNRAENFLFIKTNLYELIEVGDDARAEFTAIVEKLVKEREEALRQERRINELKQQIVRMQLGGRWG